MKWSAADSTLGCAPLFKGYLKEGIMLQAKIFLAPFGLEVIVWVATPKMQ